MPFLVRYAFDKFLHPYILEYISKPYLPLRSKLGEGNSENTGGLPLQQYFLLRCLLGRSSAGKTGRCALLYFKNIYGNKNKNYQRKIFLLHLLLLSWLWPHSIFPLGEEWQLKKIYQPKNYFYKIFLCQHLNPSKDCSCSSNQDQSL